MALALALTLAFSAAYLLTWGREAVEEDKLETIMGALLPSVRHVSQVSPPLSSAVPRTSRSARQVGR